MKKIIIAAKSSSNAIGADNDLLWHLPADLAHFYSTIIGKYVLTGRKSYESAQGSDTFPLAKKTIVLTSQKGYKAENVKVLHHLNEAFQWAEEDGAKELYILGGGAIYAQSLPMMDLLIITEVHTDIDGTVYFPEIDPMEWEEVSRMDFDKDENNPYSYSFVRYEKRTS